MHTASAPGARVVTLHPIRPGQERICPSWKGFPKGTLIRLAGARPTVADTQVTTLDGTVIVGYLPWTFAVARAQMEAECRNECVRVVGGPDDYSEYQVMSPAGVFVPDPSTTKPRVSRQAREL